MHPARAVQNLAGRLGIAPVPQHHAITTSTQFTYLPTGNNAAVFINHLALQMWLGAPHAADPPLQIIICRGLGGHWAGFSHAISDLHFGHVHVVDDPLHDFDRTSGTGHDPGTQAGQIQVDTLRKIELGDKHRRHAIECSGLLLRHCLQSG
ncbi:hypothetical protein D3C80_1253730 [compost metagenome]